MMRSCTTKSHNGTLCNRKVKQVRRRRWQHLAWTVSKTVLAWVICDHSATGWALAWVITELRGTIRSHSLLFWAHLQGFLYTLVRNLGTHTVLFAMNSTIDFLQCKFRCEMRKKKRQNTKSPQLMTTNTEGGSSKTAQIFSRDYSTRHCPTQCKYNMAYKARTRLADTLPLAWPIWKTS